MSAYAEEAHGAIYWSQTYKRGLSPLELVRRATTMHSGLFRPPLEKLNRLDKATAAGTVGRVTEAFGPPGDNPHEPEETNY